jgi:hypothetical protein
MVLEEAVMENSQYILEKGGTNMLKQIKIINVFARVMVGALVIGLYAVGTVSAKDGHNARDDHYTYGDAQLMLNSYPPVYGPGGGTTSGLDIRPFPGTPFETYRYCVEDWHVLAYQHFTTVFGPFNPAKTDCLDLDCESCEDCLREIMDPFDQRGDWTRPGDPTSDPDPLDPFYLEDDLELNFTPQDAFVFLGRLEAVFTLDGDVIQVLRTSVSQLLFNDRFLSFILGAKKRCEDYYNMTCDFQFNFYAVQWGNIYPPGRLTVGEHTLKMVVTYHAATGEESERVNNTIRFKVYEHDEACHGETCEPI